MKNPKLSNLKSTKQILTVKNPLPVSFFVERGQQLQKSCDTLFKQISAAGRG